MFKSVLYLCPSFPYPADNGGKAVFVNHINLLKKNSFKIHGVFLDVDEHGVDNDKLIGEGFNDFKIFSRKIPRAKGIGNILKSIYYFIFNYKPRAFIARYNPELQAYVQQAIASGKYDYIIFDHFTALSFIDDFKILKTARSIYIAHNFETKVIANQYKSQTNLIEKLIYYIECQKTERIERAILSSVSKTITISSVDKKEIFDFYNNVRMETIPEIIPLQDRLWAFKNTKNILFVGGTDYFPNYEAVDWLVKILMPEINNLNAGITCTIVGNSKNYKDKSQTANVFFTGMISHAELEQLYCSSNLFISPVILGSGIKVKVLTALSYSIPVLCTRESMMGLEFLDGLNRQTFIRKNLQQTIQLILKLLNSSDEQIELSLNIQKTVKENFNLIIQKWAFRNV